MSEIFEALKTIQAGREAAAREYSRVAARVRDPASVAPSPPVRRRGIGIGGGLLAFFAGVAVTVLVLVTLRPRPLPVHEEPTRAAPLAAEREVQSPAAAPDAGAAEPAAMAMVAIVTGPPEPSVASAPMGAGDSASAEDPVALDEPARAPPPAGDFWVQVGAFNDPENAARLRARLQERWSAAIRPGRPGALPWVLAIGPYADERSAGEVRTALAREGLPGFVVRGDR